MAIPEKNNGRTFKRYSNVINETIGLLGLLGLLSYFLKTSWRKWCDPIVDFGQQCYDTWRVSQGALVYHDFVWNYGPFSISFNALLFRWFGSSIMVLALANLIIYGGIVACAYWSIRVAWGRIGALAALAVFISVFSFSHVLAVGNYNYATPYSAESVHGFLLILIAALIAVQWSQKVSFLNSFWLGLIGGLAIVIKPEFMLALGLMALGISWVRWRQKIITTGREFFVMMAGLILPTAFFTAWFARRETWRQAFIDASQAWWLVVVQQVQRGSGQQQSFSGFNDPATNAWFELKYGLVALLACFALWLASWFFNQRWPLILRVIIVAAATLILAKIKLEKGWIDIGRSFPGLLIAGLLIVFIRLRRQFKLEGMAQKPTIMAFVLLLLAIAMLARMVLHARVYHLGFFQAALAGMVIAAMLVTEIPSWSGEGFFGRFLATIGAFLIIGIGCTQIAEKSIAIRADQTQKVGWGSDQFYATKREFDGMGFLVDWTAEQLRDVPLNSTIMVLPEGTMINYLIRRKSMEPGWKRDFGESEFLQSLKQNPPDYLVFITRDISEFGVERFGAEGNFGREIVKWMADKYSVAGHYGGDPFNVKDYPGSLIMRLKQPWD